MLLKISFSVLVSIIYANESYKCTNEICKFLGNEVKTFKDTTLETLLKQAKTAALEQGVSNRFGLLLDVPILNNYGCWCHTGDYYSGPTFLTDSISSKDDYDEACKSKHMGYDCIRMDAESENEICDPTTTSYDMTMVPQSDGSFTLECSNSIANNWCKRKVCLVDIRYLITQDNLEQANVSKNFANYGHPGFHNNVGNFDVNTCKPTRDNTPGKGQGKKKDIQRVCCGDYPYRVVFDLKNSNSNACCEFKDNDISEAYKFDINVGHIYNSLSNQCCANGVKSLAEIC